MKPTVEDQLRGTCRVLESVVAPCVSDPMARTILEGLIANLRMLTGALPAVPAFMRQDNEATACLLSDLLGALPAVLRERVRVALAQPEPDPTDTAALDARNTLLRELLAEAVRLDDLTPAQHRAIVQHMSERASRVPMRYVSTAPSPPPATPA